MVNVYVAIVLALIVFQSNHQYGVTMFYIELPAVKLILQ